MKRKRHPKKEIEEALQHAETKRWRVRPNGGHPWGKILCPHNSDDCRCGEFCITSIWSTPKNTGNYARQIRRIVDGCTKTDDEDTGN